MERQPRRAMGEAALVFSERRRETTAVRLSRSWSLQPGFALIPPSPGVLPVLSPLFFPFGPGHAEQAGPSVPCVCGRVLMPPCAIGAPARPTLAVSCLRKKGGAQTGGLDMHGLNKRREAPTPPVRASWRRPR